MVKIREKIRLWKRSSVNERTDVNEDSLWRDIVNISEDAYDENLNMINQQADEYGVLTQEEENFINSFPLFTQVSKFIRETPTYCFAYFNAYKKDGNAVYVLRYPTLDNKTSKNVFFDVTIVTKTFFVSNIDFYGVVQGDDDMRKSFAIHYDVVPPNEWIREQSMFNERGLFTLDN